MGDSGVNDWGLDTSGGAGSWAYFYNFKIINYFWRTSL